MICIYSRTQSSGNLDDLNEHIKTSLLNNMAANTKQRAKQGLKYKKGNDPLGQRRHETG